MTVLSAITHTAVFLLGWFLRVPVETRWHQADAASSRGELARTRAKLAVANRKIRRSHATREQAYDTTQEQTR